MTDPTGQRGGYRSAWSSRAAIIGLGVTLGLGAKWIRQTWEYLAHPPAAVTAPTEGTPVKLERK
ncbi:hypothetical protein [Anatilimnocola floriformis]|uniref:hypothetical protein n=1 Tax=Anatilimnocola floriformis TaxID=2948575 RepID=UPI0020C47094|nr:hypothetical protein [Anatilimnocola floriformis]